MKRSLAPAFLMVGLVVHVPALRAEVAPAVGRHGAAIRVAVRY